MNINSEALSCLIDNPRLFSTVRVCLVDKDSGEVVEALYGEAAEYGEDIGKAMAQFSTQDYPANDLMHYFTLPQDKQMEASIKGKIHSAKLTTHSENTFLYAVLDLEMSADLTTIELDEFTKQIRFQYWDGWGAEFENTDISTSCGDIVCLRLFHDDLTFYTADEFDDMCGRERLANRHNRAHGESLPEQAAPNTLLGLMRSGISFYNVILRSASVNDPSFEYDTMYKCINNQIHVINQSALEKHDLSEWADVLTAPVEALTPIGHNMTLSLRGIKESRVADFAEMIANYEAQEQAQRRAMEPPLPMSTHMPY